MLQSSYSDIAEFFETKGEMRNSPKKWIKENKDFKNLVLNDFLSPTYGLSRLYILNRLIGETNRE